VPGVSCVTGERSRCGANLVSPDRSFRTDTEGYHYYPAVGWESLDLAGASLESTLGQKSGVRERARTLWRRKVAEDRHADHVDALSYPSGQACYRHLRSRDSSS
jgi:hypothetical protein